MRPIPEFLPSHEALDVSRLRSAKRPYAELVWKAVETGKIDEPTFGSLATFVRMPYDIEDHPEAERLFLDIVGEFGTLPEGRPPVSDEEADFLRTMSEWTIVQATTKERSEGIRAKVLQTLEPDLKAVMDTVHLWVDAVLSHDDYRPDVRSVPAETFGLLREDALWCLWSATRNGDRHRNYDTKRIHHSQDSAIRNALWKYGHKM